jgi:hypothetical protein
VDDGLGEAGGVVLDADGASGLVYMKLADSVDFANASEGHGGGFAGRRGVAVHHIKLRHGVILSAGELGSGGGGELLEEVDDLGAGPVLGADELAAKLAVLVDDVGFGIAEGAVEGVRCLGAVADGEEVDVVAVEEGLVGGGVCVCADAEDLDLRQLVLEGDEAGELLEAGSAPGSPEIEDDDAAAEVGEVDGAGVVGDGELRGELADLVGAAAAVAAGGGGQEQDGCGWPCTKYGLSELGHDVVSHFL